MFEDTGTTAKLYWDASAESLGIGTTTPDHLLHIEASGDSALRLTRTGVRSFRQYINSTGKFIIRDLSGTPADRLTIDTSGNVGIGTSSPNVHGWTKALSIDGGTSNSSAVELNQNGTKVGALSLQGDQRVQMVNHTANPLTRAQTV